MKPIRESREYKTILMLGEPTRKDCAKADFTSIAEASVASFSISVAFIDALIERADPATEKPALNMLRMSLIGAAAGILTAFGITNPSTPQARA